MNLTSIAARNIGRNKLRTTLTVAVVATATLFFILLRTVVWSWTSASEFSKKDRIATRHNVSFIMQLPKRYTEDIAQIPGVTALSYANWFGAKDLKNDNYFFATIATDPKSLLNVYSEIKTSEISQSEYRLWSESIGLYPESMR